MTNQKEISSQSSSLVQHYHRTVHGDTILANQEEGSPRHVVGAGVGPSASGSFGLLSQAILGAGASAHMHISRGSSWTGGDRVDVYSMRGQFTGQSLCYRDYSRF